MIRIRELVDFLIIRINAPFSTVHTKSLISFAKEIRLFVCFFVFLFFIFSQYEFYAPSQQRNYHSTH